MPTHSINAEIAMVEGKKHNKAWLLRAKKSHSLVFALEVNPYSVKKILNTCWAILKTFWEATLD